MKHRFSLWIFYFFGVVVILIAMLLMTQRLLDIQKNWNIALIEASMEENARMALWRSDSLLSSAILLENTRSVSRFNQLTKNNNKLLTDLPPLFITHRFEWHKTGRFTSPVVSLSASDIFGDNHFDIIYSRLPILIELSDTNIISAPLNNDIAINAQELNEQNKQNINDDSQSVEEINWNGYLINQGANVQANVARNIQQSFRNSREFSNRERQININNFNVSNNDINNRDNDIAANNPKSNDSQLSELNPNSKTTVSMNNELPVTANPQNVPDIPGTMKAFIINGNLILIRQCSTNNKKMIQGCILDKNLIIELLVNKIKDILPNASFVPFDDTEAVPPGRRLTSIPLRLRTGELPFINNTNITPMEKTLLTAWSGTGFAIIAVGILLYGVTALAERRATFVSAVTHELRTPLTTFRMYSEMLANGMVPAEKQPEYLETLVSESRRLGHLVENVLAFARLERGAGKRLPEYCSPNALITRTTERLREIADQSGMTLEIEPVSPEIISSGCQVYADFGSTEQILFNLVDNACKYASRLADKRIRIYTEIRNGKFAIIVADNGPGISVADRSRVFKAFRKSAKDAANTAPGIGLGLALSRRLARSMNGDLHIDDSSEITSGAVFVLTLPVRSLS